MDIYIWISKPTNKRVKWVCLGYAPELRKFTTIISHWNWLYHILDNSKCVLVVLVLWSINYPYATCQY